MTEPRPRVEVATTIRAPRERVFDAWLDPDRLARFLCAGDTHVARIEVDVADVARLAEPGIREQAVEGLRSLGYRYVALDLEGFRSGSMNPEPS